MRGLKIYWKCDHIVDGKKYDKMSCPKCFGLGYYKDIKLDNVGNFIEVQGKDLVEQEVLYLLDSVRGMNVFYSRYGIDYTGDEDLIVLDIDLMLKDLKSQQEGLGRKDDELIDKWEINVRRADGIKLYIEILIYLANYTQLKIAI